MGYTLLCSYLMFTFYMIISVVVPELKIGDAFDRLTLVFLWIMVTAFGMIIGGTLLFSTE
jgi:hypothetical protein